MTLNKILLLVVTMMACHINICVSQIPSDSIEFTKHYDRIKIDNKRIILENGNSKKVVQLDSILGLKLSKSDTIIRCNELVLKGEIKFTADADISIIVEENLVSEDAIIFPSKQFFLQVLKFEGSIRIHAPFLGPHYHNQAIPYFGQKASSGTNGHSGGNGGDGRDAKWDRSARGGGDGSGGGNGQNGGKGYPGPSGAPGRAAANLEFVVLQKVRKHSKIIMIANGEKGGGEGGRGGLGGRGGSGGRGGKGGDGSVFNHGGSSGLAGRPGADGPDGVAGKPGLKGPNGRDGEIFEPILLIRGDRIELPAYDELVTIDVDGSSK